MNQEKMWRYAIRGVQTELFEARQKLDAVNALGDGGAGLSASERERMARALEIEIKRIEEDVHELKDFPVVSIL